MSLLDRLVRDQAELEAAELAQECGTAGCTRIANLAARNVARVTGCVHSVAASPPGTPPRLEIELYDGTAILRLVWLGRREIAAIRPGVFLTVHGRCTTVDGRLTVFNPSYRLVPSRG